jgi:hypothetical protein
LHAGHRARCALRAATAGKQPRAVPAGREAGQRQGEVSPGKKNGATRDGRDAANAYGGRGRMGKEREDGRAHLDGAATPGGTQRSAPTTATARRRARSWARKLGIRTEKLCDWREKICATGGCSCGSVWEEVVLPAWDRLTRRLRARNRPRAIRVVVGAELGGGGGAPRADACARTHARQGGWARWAERRWRSTRGRAGPRLGWGARQATRSRGPDAVGGAGLPRRGGWATRACGPTRERKAGAVGRAGREKERGRGRLGWAGWAREGGLGHFPFLFYFSNCFPFSFYLLHLIQIQIRHKFKLAPSSICIKQK